MRKSILLLGMLIPGLALANDFKFYTYIDGSYNYLLRSNQFISGEFDRVFDLEENGLTLHQLAFSFGYQPQGFGGLVNIITGADADVIAPYGWNPYFGSETFGIDPTQVYLQYAKGPWALMGGLFVSTAGAEVIDPTLNINYSRSILDGFAEPFTFMGFRFTYTVNNMVNMLLGINNGWDSIRDTPRRKTTELGFTYAVNSAFSIAVVEYNGVQRAEDRTARGPKGVRNLLDIVTTWNYSDTLTFILNYDYGLQSNALLPDFIYSKAVWQGSAFYVNYKWNDAWQVSLRSEIFEDKNGYRTGVVQTWKEVTFSIGYAPIKSFLLRGEVRRDFSSANSFRDSRSQGSTNNQQSYGLEAYYKFTWG